MEAMALRSEPSAVVTEVDSGEGPSTSQPVLRLRLQKKAKTDRKVEWREDTIDNENMGKKKSKCCCIYKKPTKFGESSSEDDEECEHCFGHPEKRRRNKKGTPHDHDHDHDHEGDSVGDNEQKDDKPECDAADGSCVLKK